MLGVAEGRQVRVAKGDSGSLRHLMCLRRGGEKDAEKWGRQDEGMSLAATLLRWS